MYLFGAVHSPHNFEVFCLLTIRYLLVVVDIFQLQIFLEYHFRTDKIVPDLSVAKLSQSFRKNYFKVRLMSGCHISWIKDWLIGQFLECLLVLVAWCCLYATNVNSDTFNLRQRLWKEYLPSGPTAFNYFTVQIFF